MKFGHNLPRNQVPEWAASYINYKGLKKLIKAAAESVREGEDPDLAEFFFTLDRNLEDVDGFYNKKYGDASRRLRLLYDRYGKALPADGMDRDEVEDLMGALLELRGQLRKLQWYGEVNRRGFIKITKKLDKRIPVQSSQRQYLATKVDPKPFATNFRLAQDMRAVNDWMSALGEVKTFDDVGSSRSSASMRHVSSRAILNLPPGLLDTVDQAIRNDDAAIISEVLLEANTDEDSTTPAFQKLLLNLLQRAISCKSKLCIETLLKRIVSLDEEDDLNKRNCIHRLVISIGRTKTAEQQSQEPSPSKPFDPPNFITPAESPMMLPPPWTRPEEEATNVLSKKDDSVKLLTFLLDKLQPSQRSALQARDSYGRIPLHYAAHYGFVSICEEVVKHMQDWGQFDVSHGIDSAVWQDNDGFAPLHLSVVGGHYLTTKALLEAEKWQGHEQANHAFRRSEAKSGAVLAIATKSNYYPIVQLLVDAGADINYQDEQGETALHVAARFGHDKCAEILIHGSEEQKTNLEITEKTFAWAPLFIACVDGHLGVVNLLIEAGAELGKTDSSGWTPREHAALRGHMDIARRLTEVLPPPLLTAPDSSSGVSGSPPNPHSLGERRSNVNIKESGKMSQPVKTFGHRYLNKESMILLSLGTMDMRKNVDPVKLDDIPLADAHATQLDTALSVVVSAKGANGESTVIDLPVQENISTDPITFTAEDPTKVKLLFDIVPTYAGSNERRVGRGVALLSSIKPSIGSKRITLQSDISVPIVAANTLEVIGSVNFNFLIISPFSHPNMSITEERTYWKSMASTMLIGHRGTGKNFPPGSSKSLQLGENTIQSFITAANLGASYVEFDVQLTKDLVPVIYHDFLVSETGIDAPVHTLTLEQFLHIGEGQTPRPSRPGSPMTYPESATSKDLASGKDRARKPRSYSMTSNKDDRTSELAERMKHTRDFKKKGFKGNDGNFIQSPFTTLEEMFKKLPESIGFNIEMKYPMLFESEDEEMDTYAVELNSFVDTVLTKVYDLGRKRNIIFSSFNPDICLLLSFKQPSIPILFLTDSGCSPIGDIRASSLQEAIRFASKWNLLGIVSAAEPLVTCPRLVKVVKESGLVCVSYGTLNNEPYNVNVQVKEGIDAVIVDSVLKIRKGLTEGDSKTAPGQAQTQMNGATNGTVNGANGIPIPTKS
ncbi:glycerophosphocholine phosphodiesterase [Rhizodiscina lignyota]|uniref:Glycerophosphocholine phosphodiesterase n=1 Tax=Rhizodiscina lignyota TaxID=1504668 RepID=A0A9P4IA87_9PEZI|nr:glycerophosphocholine phosphodiesterase [Rhizodiscina lignyota]